MSILRNIIRGLLVTAGVAVGLIIFAGVASAAPQGTGNGDTAVISVDSADCVTVNAHSTKDLSNVVLQFADGTVQKFDGLTGHDGTFSGTGANADKVVVGVWVKSGSNGTDDGPGYGEYHAVSCSTTSGSPSGSDESSTPSSTSPSNDDSNSNDNNASHDDTSGPAASSTDNSPTTTPASIGDALSEERPAPAHDPATQVTGAVLGDLPANASPAAVAATTAVATSAATPAPAVSSTSSARPTQVLGVQYAQGGESLAFTGSSTGPMAITGLALLGLGAAMIQISRRRRLA